MASEIAATLQGLGEDKACDLLESQVHKHFYFRK